MSNIIHDFPTLPEVLQIFSEIFKDGHYTLFHYSTNVFLVFTSEKTKIEIFKFLPLSGKSHF